MKQQNKQTYHWLAIFEMFIGMPVERPQAPEDEPPTMQLVAQKWSRMGDVYIAPGRSTDDVLAEIVATCKEGGVPKDAMLIAYTLNPMFLNGE